MREYIRKNKLTIYVFFVGVLCLITGGALAFFNASFRGVKEQTLNIGEDLTFTYNETGSALALDNNDIIVDIKLSDVPIAESIIFLKLVSLIYSPANGYASDTFVIKLSNHLKSVGKFLLIELTASINSGITKNNISPNIPNIITNIVTNT